MDLINFIEKRKVKNTQIRVYVTEAKKTCTLYFNSEYVYSKEEALEALGLDIDFLDQLIEDFVVQILQSNKKFLKYLVKFKEDKKNNIALDFSQFQELVHKNLGVARNLRIKDVEEVLACLMSTKDVEEIHRLLHVLEACTIVLHPCKSYDTLLMTQHQL